MAHVKSILLLSLLSLGVILSSGCTKNQPQLDTLQPSDVILAYGDSLTYGTGVNSATESYPAVLQTLTGHKVINAGIPGEVSRDGLRRLPLVLKAVKPSLVILCHGGNDLIRKIGKAQLKKNLDEMINLIQDTGANVVLIGVPSFTLMLDVPFLYEELAEQHGLPLELETLKEIEGNPKKKADQTHPNAEGYKELAQSIYTLMVATGLVPS